MESIAESGKVFEKSKSAEILPIYQKGLFGPGQLFNDEENDLLKDRRWGFWSTLGYSTIIVSFYYLVAGIVAGFIFGLELATNPDLDQKIFFDSLLTSGFFMSLATLATTWSTVGLVILFVALRKGITIQDYLGFSSVSFAVVLRWLVIMVLFLYICDAIYSLLGLVESDFVVKAYSSAGYQVLFWIAVVIAAPVAEEFFFRGFVFEGIRGSKLGPVGAILITSVVWGLIHQQYGIPEIVLIASFGVILGIAKIKTQSLYTPIALHSAFNLIAMVQVSATS